MHCYNKTTRQWESRLKNLGKERIQFLVCLKQNLQEKVLRSHQLQMQTYTIAITNISTIKIIQFLHAVNENSAPDHTIKILDPLYLSQLKEFITPAFTIKTFQIMSDFQTICQEASLPNVSKIY